MATSSQPGKPETSAVKRLWYALPFLIIIIFWASYPFWLPLMQLRLDASLKLNGLGQFGDAFGSLNTLFSGLAFAGLIVTIVIQSSSIAQTKHDLERQQRLAQKELFEGTFFRLLDFNSKNGEHFKYLSQFGQGVVATGEDGFKSFETDIVSNCLINRSGSITPLKQRLLSFFSDFGGEGLSHYVRNFHKLLEVVETSQIEDKRFYMELIRAQLSSHQLFVLFYAGYCVFPENDMLVTLKKYAFFEHLPNRNILPEVTAVYGKEAFGRSREHPIFF